MITSHRNDDRAAVLGRRLGWTTLVGAGLVVTYWLLYFTHALPVAPEDGPPGALESTFVVADAVLSLTLLGAGRALLARRATGPFLLVAAASMCLYLGVLDLTVYARHGVAAPLPWVTGALCLAGGAIGVRYGWTLWRIR